MISLKDYAAVCVQDADGVFVEEKQGESIVPNIISAATQMFVENTLNSDFNDTKDVALKKIMAAAAYIAESNGISLPDSLKPEKPIDLAISVDEALDTVKGAYKIATGSLSVDEFLEHKAEKIVARVERLAHKTIDKVADVAKKFVDKGVAVAVEKGIDVVVNAVSRICPSATYIREPIKAFARAAAPKVKSFVKKGIDVAVSGAKALASGVISGVKSVWNWAKSKVASLVN